MGFFDNFGLEDVAGSLIGGIFGAAGASSQNDQAAAAASAQMAHQIGMYKNRYQWQMEDMRKAGLNPILAYKQGAPGGGAGASYQPVNVGAAAVQGASSASQIRTANNQADQLQASAANQNAQAAVAKETAEQTKIVTAIRKLEVASAQAQHDMAKHQISFWNTKKGREIAEMGAMTGAIPGAGQLALAAKGGAALWDRVNEWFTGENSAKSPDISTRPRRTNAGTLTKAQKDRISKLLRSSSQPHASRTGGNWRKYYSPTR